LQRRGDNPRHKAQPPTSRRRGQPRRLPPETIWDGRRSGPPRSKRATRSRRSRKAARPHWKTATMPLRVELKPFERIIIGESVIINSGTRTCFLIDGDTPILRERDTVSEETADTPAKRLYHCVQMMYLKNDIARFKASYLGFVGELEQSRPGEGELIA